MGEFADRQGLRTRCMGEFADRQVLRTRCMGEFADRQVLRARGMDAERGDPHDAATTTPQTDPIKPTTFL